MIFGLALRAYYEQQQFNFHTSICAALFKWILILRKFQYDDSGIAFLP